ncbi:MAG TPA: S8 family serine peptidase [Acidimicrobiales bacterium]|nr:S8 family serine peptidase [Acidimicrobiales bacterium]
MLRLPGVARIDELTPEWAWGGATGKGVRVAVVDSGIEADHPDLGDCVDAEGGVAVSLDDSGEAVLTPGPHEDAFGHGTACAGIIHRLAPEARLTSVRVLGPGLAGKAAAFLAGLGWAIEQGFDVVNLSLGTTKRDWALAFYEMCDRAYFSGTLLVTAANNMARPSFPSLYASVTSVACNLATDPFRFHYNPDPPTEFLAPGIDVELSWRGGGRMTGTGNSYAAPHLAGIAALVKSKHPGLRPFQLKTVLWATAANVQEAPTAAGRLTGALAASRLTTGGSRATSALRALRPSAPL